MEFNNVLLEKEGNIATVTINRPKALNALNSETLKELNAVIEDLENDKEIYCVILTGSGEKSFVAGADISEMKDLDSKGGKEFGLLGNKVFRRLENLDKPVIAAISGFALGGGCELAMACDIRIASEKAKFAQPEAGLGITPGFGGTQRLPRLVGEGKAKELIYTCAIVKADGHETDDFTEAKAIDGDDTTRWASPVALGEHWISLDYGKEISIQSFKIHWERTNATKYRLEKSLFGNISENSTY